MLLYLLFQYLLKSNIQEFVIYEIKDGGKHLCFSYSNEISLYVVHVMLSVTYVSQILQCVHKVLLEF